MAKITKSKERSKHQAHHSPVNPPNQRRKYHQQQGQTCHEAAYHRHGKRLLHLCAHVGASDSVNPVGFVLSELRMAVIGADYIQTDRTFDVDKLNTIEKSLNENYLLVPEADNSFLLGKNLITDKPVNLVLPTRVQVVHIIKYSRYIFK